MALAPKQQRFVEEYLIDLNATAAYKRAGYNAEVNAARLLRKAQVQEALREAQRQRSARTQITADAVLTELAKIAFSDMRSFAVWGPDGIVLKPSADLSPEAGACVAEVSQTISEGGGSIKFKLHSKTEALRDLGRHLGLFVDRVELQAGVKLQ